jgi:hypothetical protein
MEIKARVVVRWQITMTPPYYGSGSAMVMARHDTIVRKPFGTQRYEKDTKTFWIQRYENL